MVFTPGGQRPIYAWVDCEKAGVRARGEVVIEDSGLPPTKISTSPPGTAARDGVAIATDATEVKVARATATQATPLRGRKAPPHTFIRPVSHDPKTRCPPLRSRSSGIEG